MILFDNETFATSAVTPTAQPYQPVIDPIDPNPAVEVGRDLTLFCNARGAEPLTVQWVRGENQPLSERATQLPDGRLVIRNIRPEDAGVYICIARNIYASTQLVVNVYVTGESSLVSFFEDMIERLELFLCLNIHW